MELKVKRSKKLSWLVGRCEPCDESSAVVIEITYVGKGIAVRSFNKDDGEEYVVSRLKWKGKSLSFETSVSSNKWRTRNTFRPVSAKRVIQELTFWEPWKKVAQIREDNGTVDQMRTSKQIF
jgi:hypothetical protein